VGQKEDDDTTKMKKKKKTWGDPQAENLIRSDLKEGVPSQPLRTSTKKSNQKEDHGMQ